ncbi:MAG: ATP-binding protein [Myxococcales bacterium]|nr:ATP-binding protein [Myxococcales bacterium]
MQGAAVYPFSALVGQERMRLALVLTAVNPRLGGVLVQGERGTAKSTVVRALASLLPEIEVVEGCPYGCDPDERGAQCDACRVREAPPRARRRPRLETLPLGVTEDRLVGTLDLERALRAGEKHFEPGLLARAHRGVLYVDEVNLLEDHIVDLLLDSAAMGLNVVEREGVSHTHPARFILVGTMNPEEGELRPQLLDRFGLCVDVTAEADPAARSEIVLRRLAWERDPVAFRARFEAEEQALAERIRAARQVLDAVAIDAGTCELAARLSLRIGVDGHRADILTVKAAATLAALDGRRSVSPGDVARAAELVYPHRVRRKPFEDRALGTAEIAAAVAEALRGEVPAKKAATSLRR